MTMDFGMYSHLVLLADLSYSLGLIGLHEYKERVKVAFWLPGDLEDDPRGGGSDFDETDVDRRPERDGSGPSAVTGSEREDPSGPILSLTLLKNWVFTKNDVDCYPSVPHGHLASKTSGWPKLNPYNGRVFSGVHCEDPKARLSKSDMKNIWSDKKFIRHCREQIIWYSSFAPEYKFANARRGRLVFPKWR